MMDDDKPNSVPCLALRDPSWLTASITHQHTIGLWAGMIMSHHLWFLFTPQALTVLIVYLLGPRRCLHIENIEKKTSCPQDAYFLAGKTDE